ncbi:MAG: hypothetical protein JWQ20_2351 [Conexibacter sp.]|nr:hypothetical protein [Conexibacter sp.]
MAMHDTPVALDQEPPPPPHEPVPPPHARPRRRPRHPTAVEDGGLGASGIAAAAVAAFGLIVFAIQLPALLRAISLNGDIASMPALVTLLSGAPPDRVVTLSNAPEYESLTILRATLHWSLHRELWQALPFALTGAGIIVLARTTWVTWGRWAAAMVVATLAVTAEGLRMTLFGINAHGFSLLSVIVLGAVLVAFARKPPRSRVTWVVTGLALIALVAPGAPDLLLMLAGLGPFALAGVGTWWLSRDATQRRLAIFTVSVSAISAILGLLFTAHMRGDDIFPTSTFVVTFATADQLQRNVALLIEGFVDIADLHVLGREVNLRSSLGAVIAAPVIAGFLTASWYSVKRLRAYVHDRALARSQAPERLAFLVFWSAVLVLSLAACLASTVPREGATGHYLVPAFYGVAALAPALALGSRRARGYVAVGVLVFSLGAIGRHVAEGQETFGDGPTAAEAASIQSFVTAHGAHIGYAGYQDAEVLTWQTHARLRVFPILSGFGCLREICPYYVMTVSSWYQPREGVRSFIVTQPQVTEAHTHTLPRSAGAPIARARFNRLTVFVYDHDVARDFGAELPPADRAELAVGG